MKLQYGGGITSKRLSEIPDNINKMLRDNYKKVAFLNTSNIFLKTNTESKIKINVNFTPSRFFVVLKKESYDGYGYDYATIDSLKGLSILYNNVVMVDITKGDIKYDNITKELKIKPTRVNTGPNEVIEVIAIEQR